MCLKSLDFLLSFKYCIGFLYIGVVRQNDIFHRYWRMYKFTVELWEDFICPILQHIYHSSMLHILRWCLQSILQYSPTRRLLIPYIDLYCKHISSLPTFYIYQSSAVMFLQTRRGSGVKLGGGCLEISQPNINLTFMLRLH